MPLTSHSYIVPISRTQTFIDIHAHAHTHSRTTPHLTIVKPYTMRATMKTDEGCCEVLPIPPSPCGLSISERIYVSYIRVYSVPNFAMRVQISQCMCIIHTRIYCSNFCNERTNITVYVHYIYAYIVFRLLL